MKNAPTLVHVGGVRGVTAAIAALGLVLSAFVGLTIAAPTASAATGSDFRPGDIISDDNFYNASAMSEVQIQAFLVARGGSCTTGFECIKNYTVGTTSRAADAMCGTYVGAAAEPASRVIFKVAQACGISPMVLLATLEKESSLVSTSSPSESRYRISMGYACPDSGSCDSKYYGFYNQIYSAAWQFKRYSNPAGTSNTYNWYPVGKATAVRLSPNAACGSTSVIIENKATAALYYYTPYQPNAAALSNLYGTGDSCSAYGNRNFWRIYSDWFGTPTGTPFGNVDQITPQWGGVHISGWLRAQVPDASEYIWVNVDGVGTAYPASSALGWFPVAFPGYSTNHGFDEIIPTTSGSHEICIYRASTGTVMKCSIVNVPRGYGNVDSATPVPGGVHLTGWSVDADRTGVSYIWVNVDGTGGPFATNTTLNWLPAMFPGTSASQGFDITVKMSPGPHQVCVYGADGANESLGCRTVVAPAGSGAFDTITGVAGGAQITGWYVDYNGGDHSFVWVTADGNGGPFVTNVDLSWLAVYLPGFSTSNGFDYRLPLQKGPHQVCVYGSNSGALLGCKSVTVPYSAAGNVDTLTGGAGTINLTGWSADLTTPSPGYVWVNVNGVGGPFVASQAISWFDILYPGEGQNHGFNITLNKPPGTYQVCVYGSESISLGCKTVTVS